ncbi:MAG: helix-turn-helix transcriptional regulator [Phycisphaerae bacterium]|nr:helix-turn-helix transcriptional regulator [Phycisphaerae bacterium]
MQRGSLNTLIGCNLRHHRHLAGLSERAAAAHIGVALKTYRNYECGRAGLDCDQLLQLADLIQCSVDALYRDGATDRPLTGEPPWHPYGAAALLAEFNRIRSRAARNQVRELVGRIADALTDDAKATL